MGVRQYKTGMMVLHSGLPTANDLAAVRAALTARVDMHEVEVRFLNKLTGQIAVKVQWEQDDALTAIERGASVFRGVLAQIGWAEPEVSYYTVTAVAA
jgi:hypothetical protein